MIFERFLGKNGLVLEEIRRFERFLRFFAPFGESADLVDTWPVNGRWYLDGR